MAATKIPGKCEISAISGATIVDLTQALNATASLPGLIQTKYGSLAIVSGVLQFTPGPLAVKLGEGRKATEKVKFFVNTENGTNRQIEVSYTVTGVNDDPVAAADQISLTNGAHRAINVLKNDVDFDTGDRIVVSSVFSEDGTLATLNKSSFSAGTAHGVFTVSTAGAARFIVNPTYSALSFTDKVTYEVSDGKGGFSVATVEISNNGGAQAARPTLIDLATASDTGASASDNITQATSGLLTGRALPNSAVKIFNNGVEQSLGAVPTNADGRFSVQANFVEGVNEIVVVVEDPAGVSLSSVPLRIVVDATPPDAPIGLALSEVDDTGTFSNDGKTSQVSGLTLTGTSEPLSKIMLFTKSLTTGDLVVLGSTTTNQLGQFTKDVSLAAGNHTLIAKTIDLAGNLSPESQELLISVIAPPTVALKPIIDVIKNDAGAPITEATNDVMPDLFISLGAQLPSGAQVEIFDNGRFIGVASQSSLGFEFTPSVSLTQGIHAFTAGVRDVAGSLGPLSAVKSVEIDTTPPAAPGPLDLAAADDTGLATDNITKIDQSLTLTARVAASSPNLITIKEWNDTDQNNQIDDGELTTIDPIDNSSVHPTVSNGVYRADIDLTEGEHRLLLIQSDRAGNESIPDASQVLTVIVDKTAPIAPINLSLAALDDTGAVGDNLTSQSSALTVSGEAESGVTIELYRMVGTVEVMLARVPTAANGTFSADLTLPTSTAPAGLATDIFARAVDVAGNKSAPGVMTITVDNRVPAAPSILALAAADDSASSHSLANSPTKADHITNITNDLSLSGVAEKGSSVELFRLDAGTLVSLGVVQADVSTGVYSIDVDLPEGAQQLVARATDAAGNVSQSSVNFKVTIDTTAPVAVTTLGLADADDTGSSRTDNVTSQTSGLTISATVVPGTAAQDVSIYNWVDINENGAVEASEVTNITQIPGAVLQDAAINGSTFVANLTLTDGIYNLLALQEDAAGNFSPYDTAGSNESTSDTVRALTIVVDSVAPTQIASITSARELAGDQVELSGKLNTPLSPGETIRVYDGSILLGNAVATSNGNWTYTLSNTTGAIKSYDLTTQIADAAGNLNLTKGGPGNLMLGTSGDDSLVGGNGIDFIFGFSGNDFLDGRDGNDQLFGGLGIDQLKGGIGDDKLFGGDDADVLEGEDGNDMMSGGLGNDQLRGGAGNDQLYGDAGSDKLNGGLGDDLLVGGFEPDELTGDLGTDTYRITVGDSSLPAAGNSFAQATGLVDRLIGFVRGTDILDLAGLNKVDPSAPTAAAANYDAALTAARNELASGGDVSFQYSSTGGGLLGGAVTENGFLFISADGAFGPDQLIVLVGLGPGAGPGVQF